MDVVTFTFKSTKFQGDPTASEVPLLAPNPEEPFFDQLEKYRFDDGTRLDFRGDEKLSVNQLTERWAIRTSGRAKDLSPRSRCREPWEHKGLLQGRHRRSFRSG